MAATSCRELDSTDICDSEKVADVAFTALACHMVPQAPSADPDGARLSATTQNALLSGSPRTTKSGSGGYRSQSSLTAPSPTSRSTSTRCSAAVSTNRSRCTRGCGSTGDSLRCKPSARPDPSAKYSVRHSSLRHSSESTRPSAAVQKATARGMSTTPITGIPSRNMAWSLCLHAPRNT